jgi:hypothetical protein
VDLAVAGSSPVTHPCKRPRRDESSPGFFIGKIHRAVDFDPLCSTYSRELVGQVGARAASKPETTRREHMRFMMLVKSAENRCAPPKELMDAMGKLAQEAIQAGTMRDTGGLAPIALSTRVRLSGGQVTAIDGPFTETKEVVGGYAVFEFQSKKEAVEAALRFMELHRQHWPGWEGETEVRQIFGPEDFPPRP